MSSTSTYSENQDSFQQLLENFPDFTVHTPGIQDFQNILILYENGIDENKINEFRFLFRAGLEKNGVRFGDCFMAAVKNTYTEFQLIAEIKKHQSIHYFLLIGEIMPYNPLMKSIKLTMNIRGNYKPVSDILIYLSNWKELFKFCLEINRQCRGVNYPCPSNFPKNVAFFHFILTDYQISCGTNATTCQKPYIMVFCCRPTEINYKDYFEYLCSKVTGKLKDKEFKKVIITFNNYLSLKCSNQVANEFCEIAERYFPFAEIGIAKLLFEKKSLLKEADKNQILSCTILSYHGNLTGNKILEYLSLCRSCDEMRLNFDKKTNLPEHIRLSIIHYFNLTKNYRNCELPVKRQLTDDEFDPLPLEHPNIKQRNHILKRDIDNEFSLN